MYKFKSRVTGDLIMLEPNGRQILTLIGKQEAASNGKGILLPQDLPAAIVALQAAVDQDEAQRAQDRDEANRKGDAPPAPEGISLRQRAYPFIDMLRRCHKADREITWGV